MAVIRIEIPNLQGARGRLERIAQRLERLEWLWANLAELFVAKEGLWFKSKGRGTWPELSPAYAAWKAIHYPGAPLMVRTGDLRDQLTSSKSVLAMTDTAISLGTSLPYAAFHLGTSKMPARPPVIPVISLVAGIARRISYEIEATR